jgi:hypothetical protein
MAAYRLRINPMAINGYCKESLAKYNSFKDMSFVYNDLANEIEQAIRSSIIALSQAF